jgi:hypothetical protein
MYAQHITANISYNRKTFLRIKISADIKKHIRIYY